MDEQLIKRVPPHSTEAEQSVIASMLMNQEAMVYCVEHLLPEEFYGKQYGILFEAIRELCDEGLEVEFVTLQDRLRKKNAPPEICELGYIQGLIDALPTSAAYAQFCSLVKEKYTLRRLISTCEEVALRGYTVGEDMEELLQDSSKKIVDIATKNSGDEITPIRQVVMSVLNNIQAAAKSDGVVTGVPTGFIDLDTILTGLHPSELILVAARPAMGKTAFVLNIAAYAAFRKNFHVGIFSLEMGKDQLVSRLMAMEAMVDSQQMRTGNLADGDWDKIVEGAGIIGASNLYIDDTPGINILELRSKCRKMKLDYGLDLVCIDYLQLMSGRGKAESRQNEISEISRSLKALARELEVPVIALSQLSRAVEQRPDHRPMLSDLRESGAIEQDADVVMFIYRDDYYNEESPEKGVSEIIVAKQRSGSTGTIKLAWLGQYTKFANLSTRRDL